MLLENFNKEQSLAFVKLVADFEYADHKISSEEKKILEKYLAKLNLTKDDINKLSVQEATKVMVDSDESVRKITYFELLGVALIDGEYATSEVDYLDDLAIKFNITRAEKFSYANFYYGFDDIKKLSDEDKNKKIREIIK